MLSLISPSFLLLFHVLCPLIAGAALIVSGTRNSRVTGRIFAAVSLLLTVTSVCLLIDVLSLLDSPQLAPMLSVMWPLPVAVSGPGLIKQVVWGIDPGTACALALVPWIGLTVDRFTPSDHAARSAGSNLLLMGAIDLFLVGWDVGSFFTGAFFSILLLALLISKNGNEDRRACAGLFLSVQIVGILVFASGLGMFIASAGVIRSAPHGVPGESSGFLPDLAQIILSSISQHPAAELLWQEYRGWPTLLLLSGTMLMAACFPLQTWMSEVGASAALGERLWLLAWVKVVLFIGFRTINQLDPEALRDVGWWGLSVAIPGAVFVSSLLFAQAYLPRLQSSAVCWSQQLALITVFIGNQDLNRWLGPLLICQTAALILLTVVLTEVASRYRSIEMSSFHGLAIRAGWLIPALLVCTLTLTLSPTGLGLTQAWLTTANLLGNETWWGSLLRLLYFGADLLALAGLARIIRQFGTGPLRLPELFAGLRERTSQVADPVVTLELTWSQQGLLWLWGSVALAVGFLWPVLNFWR